MINEVFQTLTVVSIAITSVFAVGFCVANLATKYLQISCTTEQLWVAAPLVGTGVIILICQNLLYLDIRIPYSVVLIWAGVGLTLIVSVTKGQFSILNSNIPCGLIATGIAIYIVHASGLLASGVSNYYGYGWVDMYNYVAQAQFFIDFPFSSTVDTQEHLRVAHLYQHDRIGQSVLHAFIASSSGADAQQAFGATILLSPMLIFFSLFLLSTSLGIERRYAYPTAIIASLSPAIASVHLECFFSQALSMPFIFVWPLAISSLQSRPGLQSNIVVGLLFAITAAIYTEVILPLILITTIVLSISYWYANANNTSYTQMEKINRLWKVLFATLVSLGMVFLVGIIANIGYFKNAIGIMGRTTGSGVLGDIYPWAFKLEGLARLWIGHQSASPSGWLLYSLVFASAIVVSVAIAYIFSMCQTNTTPALLFSALIICIPLAPLLLSVLANNQYPYQFFKLLLMVWPLILFLAACGIAERLSQKWKGFSFICFQIIFVCTCLVFTYRITFASTKPETTAKSSRGGSHILLDENFKQIRSTVDQLEGKQIYLWWHDKMSEGSIRGRWLAYYARKNEVWTMNTSSGVGHLELRNETLKLPAIGISWRDVPVGIQKKIGSSLAGTDSFWLYTLSNENEIRSLDQASSRVNIRRSMQITVDKEAESDTWYPLWVAGQEGSATLITVNFSKSNVVFRYDQWGYKDIALKPDGKCSGTQLQVSIALNTLMRKISISCNGSIAESNYADVTPSISQIDQLGFNNVTNTLGGVIPLAKVFHGKIIEQTLY